METSELLANLLTNAPACWDYPGNSLEDTIKQYIARLEEGNNHAEWCDGDCDD